MIFQYMISIIITTYQAEHSIQRAISSVINNVNYNDIEIVVIDDCSSDKTCDIVRNLQKKYNNIKLFSMEKNSGGPSAPRNLGIKKASGKYITFLDDDDEINCKNLLEMVKRANKEKADFAKGYLIKVEGTKKEIANRFPNTPENQNDIIKYFIINQSTNSDFILLRSWLLETDLEYRTDLKIGEDTVFMTAMLIKARKVIYIDDYFLIHYNTPVNVENLSSTQNWNDKEILQQITAWEETQSNLHNININYYKLRLPAGFRNMLLNIIRFSNGISLETYNILSAFANEVNSYINKSMNLSLRYKELYKAILCGDYKEYCEKSKRRLLINGYDLKFILPVVKYLEEDFNVKVDEWDGHDSHNIKKSDEMTQWADIIWCEWMLGNAVYYSRKKNNNQRLIIRAHRFEIGRDFGLKIDWEKVNMVFTVGYYYYEQFISKFSIPREKVRLLSNYVEDTIYSLDKSENYKFNIGLVGILPKRKGFLRGIKILEALLQKDSRFKLYVMGKSYKEVSWIKNNPAEKEYFEKCEEYIHNHKLESNVIYGGFVERENLYDNLGYILSLSDDEAPESFHLAPAEAACTGSVGMLLNWPGVEYIYPKDVIYNSIDIMANEILKLSQDNEYYNEKSKYLKEYIINNYSMNKFLSDMKKYLLKVRIM